MAGSLHGMVIRKRGFFRWQMRENGPLCDEITQFLTEMTCEISGTQSLLGFAVEN